MSIKNQLMPMMLGLCLSTSVFAQSANDSVINAAVMGKISADKTLANTNINAKTIDGTVNLSGSVHSDTQAYTATELAQSVNGVVDVDTNNLAIDGSEHPLSDAFITAKIKGLYLQQKVFGDADIAAMSISVETNDGKVSLSGTADTAAQIDNAIRLAKSVKGVASVVSTVKLSTNTI
jgi:hyperosmotically inducible protein